MSLNSLLDIYCVDKEVLGILNDYRNKLSLETIIEFDFTPDSTKDFNGNYYQFLYKVSDSILEKIFVYDSDIEEFWSFYPPFKNDKAPVFPKNGENLNINISFKNYNNSISTQLASPKSVKSVLFEEQYEILKDLFSKQSSIAGTIKITVSENLEEISNSDISQTSVLNILMNILGVRSKKKSIDEVLSLLESSLDPENLDLLLKFKTSKNISFLHQILNNKIAKYEQK